MTAGAGRAAAVTFATIDNNVALSFALFSNTAILILTAAASHDGSKTKVAEVEDAYRLFVPTLGVGRAAQGS